MKRFFLYSLVLFATRVCAQTYNMPGGTINTCSGNFYDTGGSGGNYTNSQNITTTFCSNAGNCVRLVFSAFNTENGWDFLRIYDGPNTGSPLIGTYTGTTSPGTVTSSTGCLTFNFTSDGSIVAAGWAAAISCVACPPPPPAWCYSTASIAYIPDSYTAGTALALTDDVYSGVINIGFSFCFDGVSYTQLLIASNNYIDFDISSAGAFAPWSITSAIPTPTPTEIGKTLLGPWEDINPALGGTITYQLLGISPNRRFVVSWNQVPMFSCTGQLYTSQVQIFETTNCINFLLQNKPTCPGWNGGAAIQGAQRSGGTAATAFAGRNYPTVWSAVNDADQMYATCAPCNAGGPCLSILPITLLSFDARCDNSKVNITWATASQINNDYFTIERTADGVTFETIGIVDGAPGGNSSQTLYYSFADAEPLREINYYRLKQTDFDGKFEYFNIVSARCGEAGDVFIYPNPGSGIFTVEGALLNSDLIVTNPLGQKLLKTKMLPIKTEIDLSAQPSGIYFITIKAEEKTFTQKLIIN